jgi:hypothetical protein
MSDALSFVEIDGLHVELLPPRTVLSLFSVQHGEGGGASVGPDGVFGFGSFGGFSGAGGVGPGFVFGEGTGPSDGGNGG